MSVPQVRHKNQAIISAPQAMNRFSAASLSEPAKPIPKAQMIKRPTGHRHRWLKYFIATSLGALTTQVAVRASTNARGKDAIAGDSVSTPGISHRSSQERGPGRRQPRKSTVAAKPENIRSRMRNLSAPARRRLRSRPRPSETPSSTPPARAFARFPSRRNE